MEGHRMNRHELVIAAANAAVARLNEADADAIADLVLQGYDVEDAEDIIYSLDNDE